MAVPVLQRLAALCACTLLSTAQPLCRLLQTECHLCCAWVAAIIGMRGCGLRLVPGLHKGHRLLDFSSPAAGLLCFANAAFAPSLHPHLLQPWCSCWRHGAQTSKR